MKTQIKPADTRYPRLTRAILRHLGREQLEDVARHGADAGWPGFTYYNETVAFFKSHKADILDMAKQMSDDLGDGGMIQLVRGFRCLGNNGKPDYSEDEIAEATADVVSHPTLSEMQWRGSLLRKSRAN